MLVLCVEVKKQNSLQKSINFENFLMFQKSEISRKLLILSKNRILLKWFTIQTSIKNDAKKYEF